MSPGVLLGQAGIVKLPDITQDLRPRRVSPASNPLTRRAAPSKVGQRRYRARVTRQVPALLQTFSGPQLSVCTLATASGRRHPSSAS